MSPIQLQMEVILCAPNQQYCSRLCPSHGRSGSWAYLPSQSGLVLLNAVVLTDFVRKHLATTVYLSALGKAAEAHLGAILRRPGDAGSLRVKPTIRPEPRILLLATTFPPSEGTPLWCGLPDSLLFISRRLSGNLQFLRNQGFLLQDLIPIQRLAERIAALLPPVLFLEVVRVKIDVGIDRRFRQRIGRAEIKDCVRMCSRYYADFKGDPVCRRRRRPSRASGWLGHIFDALDGRGGDEIAPGEAELRLQPRAADGPGNRRYRPILRSADELRIATWLDIANERLNVSKHVRIRLVDLGAERGHLFGAEQMPRSYDHQYLLVLFKDFVSYYAEHVVVTMR